jgi:cell division protein ZipA
MEFSVREWTIIVGVLLIVAVFLDGYRRVRNERSNRIRVSLSKQVFNQSSPPTVEVEEPVNTGNPELPNGGARVVGKRRDDLQLRQSVPVLIEPVAVAPLAKKSEPASTITAPSLDESVSERKTSAETAHAEKLKIESEPLFTDSEFADSELPESEPMAAYPKRDRKARDFIEDDLDETLDDALDKQKPSVTISEKRARNFFARKDSLVIAEPEPKEVREVLIVNVLCKDAEGFKGPELLQLLLACDLRFGKKNIFHRYEKANAKGAVQFSVANLVEPGTFDLDAIDNFSTPGVSFFMSLPGPDQPVTAFNYMVETAQVLVRHLQAEMRDDAHSVMTAQTIEHCRQRIRDFERKQLTLQL